MHATIQTTHVTLNKNEVLASIILQMLRCWKAHQGSIAATSPDSSGNPLPPTVFFLGAEIVADSRCM